MSSKTEEIMKLIDNYVDTVLSNTNESEDLYSKAEFLYKNIELEVFGLEKSTWITDKQVENMYEDLKKRRRRAALIPVCECSGWGCFKCCKTEQEIRSRQGIFS
jgi:hypothetical protein